jgi:hypothetical protein
MAEVNKNFSEQGEEVAKKSPIIFTEVLLILPWLVVADIVDLFSWSGVGTVIAFVLDMIAMAIPTIWLFFKGRRAEWMAIAGLLDTIPIFNMLPIKTVAFLVIYLKDKVPTEKMGKLGESIEKGYSNVQKISSSKANPQSVRPSTRSNSVSSQKINKASDNFG